MTAKDQLVKSPFYQMPTSGPFLVTYEAPLVELCDFALPLSSEQKERVVPSCCVFNGRRETLQSWLCPLARHQQCWAWWLCFVEFGSLRGCSKSTAHLH